MVGLLSTVLMNSTAYFSCVSVGVAVYQFYFSLKGPNVALLSSPCARFYVHMWEMNKETWVLVFISIFSNYCPLT